MQKSHTRVDKDMYVIKSYKRGDKERDFIYPFTLKDAFRLF